jgi:predicted acyl esterase
VEVQLWSEVERTWITYTPTIVDVDPARRVLGPGLALALDERGLYSTTRGWLDSRYRFTRASQSLVEPGEAFGLTVVEKPQDYVFKAGHFIGLNVQTEIADWSVPKCVCGAVRLLWENGETTVTLPVVDAPSNADSLFVSDT